MYSKPIQTLSDILGYHEKVSRVKKERKWIYQLREVH